MFIAKRPRIATILFLLIILISFTSSTSQARTADNIKYSDYEGFSAIGEQTFAVESDLFILGGTTDQIRDALGLLPSDVISISTGTSDPAGFSIFNTAVTIFPTQGSSYFVMSSGDTADGLNPNTAPNTSTVLGGINNSQGNDMVQTILVLQPPVNATCLAFDFAYYSEEFPEFVGSQYNDAFIAEVGQSTFQIVGNQVIAPNNFAFDTEGNVISINTVFGVTPEDSTGTTYDAGTPLLTAKTPLENPGSPVTVTLSIMDLGDSIYDSTVFIDNFRWLYGVGCEAGADADTDRDGLLDGWETNGIDFDKDGIVDLDLPAMGADPLHKDIFVEIDYMVLGGTAGHTHKPKADALQRVINAFNSAPVPNPDNTTGIHIHIDAGPDTIMDPVTNQLWGTRSQSDVLPHQNNLGTCPSPSYAYDWSAFDNVKGAGVPGRFSIQRADVFHYNIWGHSLCSDYGTVSGISRGIPASDFLVTLGGWTGDVGTVNEQAGTFMHELGHNLSLTHGGNDHGNYKPNYISIMNYTFQTRGVRIGGLDGNIDYSRFELPNLDEAHLNETIGLSGVAGTANYGTRYYDPSVIMRIVDNINGPIDWDWDGDNGTETDVSVDVNKSGGLAILGNQNNWAHIVFTGGAVGHLGEKIDLPVVVEDPGLIDITEEEDAGIPTEVAVSVTGPSNALLAPAQSRSYTYIVTNKGLNPEIFNINAVSTKNWANLSGLPMDVSLAPGAYTTIKIVVKVPPGTAVGLSDLLTVTARSTTNSAMIDSAETTTVVSIPTTKGQCKNYGWEVYGFKNEGQCIQFFLTGK